MARSKLKSVKINIFFYLCTHNSTSLLFHYFCSVNVKDLNDNIEFWKKSKSLFSDKDSASSNTFLKKNDSFNQQYFTIKKTLFKFQSLSEKVSFMRIMTVHLKSKGIILFRKNWFQRDIV